MAVAQKQVYTNAADVDTFFSAHSILWCLEISGPPEQAAQQPLAELCKTHEELNWGGTFRGLVGGKVRSWGCRVCLQGVGG